MGKERVVSHQKPTAIVMTKVPTPGRVKTRLVGASISPEGACAIAWAMLECIVDRLHVAGFRVLVATSPDDGQSTLRRRIPSIEHTTGQGGGTLGERIANAWRFLGEGSPAAIFGIDSPDVPAHQLASLRMAVLAGDSSIRVGPTFDGGYWTIAGPRFHEALFQSIDWGTEFVYDQTLMRAKAAGLTIEPLLKWRDVDEPDDLKQLQHRIQRADEPALQRLFRRVAQVTDEHAQQTGSIE